MLLELSAAKPLRKLRTYMLTGPTDVTLGFFFVACFCFCCFLFVVFARARRVQCTLANATSISAISHLLATVLLQFYVVYCRFYFYFMLRLVHVARCNSFAFLFCALFANFLLFCYSYLLLAIFIIFIFFDVMFYFLFILV